MRSPRSVRVRSWITCASGFVAKFIFLKKRVVLWIEKPTVVLRDEVSPTVVDERKESA